MKVLSLFSGGGLGDYGLELAGMEIVGQVEIDDYCQKILNLRWPDVPKWTDIKNVRGEEILERCGAVDLISGGFPCQPFSVAGKREGSEDARDLWKEMFRIICEVRPRWVLAENVPGLLSISDGRKFGEVVRDLASIGFCVEWDCIPASALGANHQRDRVWILGHSNSSRFNGKNLWLLKREEGSISSRTSKDLENADSNRWSERCQEDHETHGNGEYVRREGQADSNNLGCTSENLAYSENWRESVLFSKRSGTWRLGSGSWWDIEPSVGRVAHGVASRVDRLKLLGNGQVVQVVEWLGKRIMEFELTASKPGEVGKK